MHFSGEDWLTSHLKSTQRPLNSEKNDLRVLPWGMKKASLQSPLMSPGSRHQPLESGSTLLTRDWAPSGDWTSCADRTSSSDPQVGRLLLHSQEVWGPIPGSGGGGHEAGTLPDMWTCRRWKQEEWEVSFSSSYTELFQGRNPIVWIKFSKSGTVKKRFLFKSISCIIQKCWNIFDSPARSY